MPPLVAMIAPVSPFRGGIAQHSTMLANALVRIADVKAISYKRLYPKFLYPGGFQKDEGTQLRANFEPSFVLDTLDPRTWVAVVDTIRDCGATVVVIPWWTFFLTPCYLFITRCLGRSGIKTVFVCHNYSDHESAWWKRALSKLVLNRADFFMVHAESIRRDLALAVPGKPCLVAPMPIYDDYPVPLEILPRRASLELLFFGFVRRYKGLDLLLHAVAALKRQDWRLSIVGECWNDADEYRSLARNLGIDDKVEFEFRYVSEAEAAGFVSRADVLILPYRSATGSAVIPLAYHYDTPVIVTPVGGLPEVVEDGETGFILPDVSVSALTDLLEVLDADECADLADGIRRWKIANNWDRLAAALLNMVL